MFTFVELPTFAKYREDYLGDADFAALQAHLMQQPASGDVVQGTGGVRKLRWSRGGMGKRGGLRVIYYVQDRKGRIWLITLYAKSARDNIAAATLRRYREAIDHAEID
jgi:hypothetical protein